MIRERVILTKIIGIISGKGGVGKTTFSANLAIALSNFGKRVVVVDCNITTPHLAYYLGAKNYSITLNNVLKALGMEIAFDPYQADFTKMRKEGELFISKVKHKTFVEVDEEGTEAAAVTSVEIEVTSIGSPGSSIIMRVDRPFVFAIRENYSQTILFIGKIVGPSLE